MSRLVVVAIGGVLGSLARYAVAVLVGEWSGQAFPWATLIVNIVGCLAIGYLATSRWLLTGPPLLRPFAIAGVLGGFTTFSAFAFETGTLLDAGHALTAALYVAVTLVFGLLAVRVGLALHGRAAA